MCWQLVKVEEMLYEEKNKNQLYIIVDRKYRVNKLIELENQDVPIRNLQYRWVCCIGIVLGVRHAGLRLPIRRFSGKQYAKFAIPVGMLKIDIIILRQEPCLH